MNKKESITSSPVETKSAIPPEAEQEILAQLSARMRISSDEIAAILEKYEVCGDEEALQTAYRKRLGQRFIASIRDEDGKRELFAAGREYVVVDCCNDPKKLKNIQLKLQRCISGMNLSATKVRERICFLDRFSPRKQGGKETRKKTR